MIMIVYELKSCLRGTSPIIGGLLLVVITVILAYSVITFGTSLWKEEEKIYAMLALEVYGNKIVIEHLGGDPILSAFDPEDWWDLNWKYRRAINITEKSGSTLNNYKVGIFIPYDSDMKPDFSDLRFTDSNGNKLRYWIQTRVENEYAYVWVEVPQIPANGNTTIYVYYGNPNAVDESDPSVMPNFIFYDDFSSDPNSNGKWRVYRYNGSPSSEFYWDGEKVYLTTAERDRGSFAFMNVDPSYIANGFVVEFDYKIWGGTGADGLSFGFYKNEDPYLTSNGCSAGGSLALMGRNGGQSEGYAVEFDCYNNSGTDPSADHIAIMNTYTDPDPGANGAEHYETYYTGKVEDGLWHHVKIMVDPSTDRVKVYLDGDLIINTTPFDINTTYGGLGFGGSTGGLTNYHVIDNVALRAYFEEPEYEIGEEEVRPVSEPSSTWKVIVPINITERSGWDLYDYQVYLGKIDYDSEMNPDFSDLRFIDENGNELPYWIEYKVDGQFAVVWVKVPFIPANGNTTIYMLYGNPTAESKSNPRETMLIYEDMSVQPSGLYGTAYYDSQNKWVVLTEAVNNQKGMIVYSINPGVGFYAKVVFWAGNGNGADAVWFGVYDNDIDTLQEDIVSGGYHFTFDEYQDRIAFTKSTDGNGASIAEYSKNDIDDGQWHTGEIWFYKNKTDGKCYATIAYDGENVITNAVDDDPQPLTGAFTTIGARTGGSNNEHRVKFIMMRKYVYPEPEVKIGNKSVTPLFTTRDWINMVVKLNGKPIGINQEHPRMKILDAKLNGQRLVPGKIYDLYPGDRLEITLYEELRHGDRVMVIYKPTRQILAVKEI